MVLVVDCRNFKNSFSNSMIVIVSRRDYNNVSYSTSIVPGTINNYSVDIYGNGQLTNVIKIYF